MYNKLYLIVRTDLSPEQQAIQAGHAAVEWARRYGHLYTHPTFVLLEAENKAHLKWLMVKMVLAGVAYIPFYEPDRNDGLTALAVHYHGSKERRLFRKLPLLKFRLK
jgi:hypothetical protein